MLASPLPAQAVPLRARCWRQDGVMQPATAARRRSTIAAATTAAEGAAAAVVKSLLTRRSYAPPRFVGPITLSKMPGKRYGLIATENLSVGQLLLVVPPLAVVFGAAGAAPSNAELLQVLQGQQVSPWQLQWLRALYRPATAEDPAAAAAAAADNDAPTADQLHQQLQQLLLHGSDDADSSSSSSSSSTGTTASGADSSFVDPKSSLAVATALDPFSAEQLSQIVAENAYSEATEDLGAALLRELDPEAVTGLWPEYALINHSCQPNTAAVVIGRYLLLRAVAPVLAGEELTASYLGRRGLAPVAVRRAFLAGAYGFHCQCERCLAEQSTFPTAYFPADNALLGVVDPQQPGSSSSSSSGDQQQGLLARVLQALGLSPRGAADVSSGSSQQQQQRRPAPRPSAQHRLLLELYKEATESLQAAVQEAVAADTARLERQLGLLQDLMSRSDELMGAVADVAPQLQQQLQQASPQVGSYWLVAAAYPLLQLQVELIELLLASGQLLVDERVLLLEQPAGGSSRSSSSSSRAMAAAGAAAASRLSLARRAGAGGSAGTTRRQQRQRQRQASGLQGWLQHSLGLAGDQGQGDDSPVTKRQLLALYVESLEVSLQVVDAVARGCEVHLSLALKHMDAVRSLYGVDAPETRLAEGLCSRAHAARYGVMKGDAQLLAALLSARRRRQLGVSLSQKMSVLAWEESVARE